MIVPENCIELRAYWTWMGKDDIARTKVKLGAEVVLEDAKENSIAVNSFELDKYPLLIDTTDIKSITKDARDYFSINNRGSKVVAFAIIINSPLSKIIANFFMGLNKPSVPVKIFNSEEDAVDWCKLYQE
jgi:hypothetical protein